MAPRVLPAGYVEDARFSWERELEKLIAPYITEPVPPTHERSVASTLPLTERNAARVYGLENDVAEVLRCHEPFQLFQMRDWHELNAQVYYRRRPLAIRLIGAVVSLLDDVSVCSLARISRRPYGSKWRRPQASRPSPPLHAQTNGR